MKCTRCEKYEKITKQRGRGYKGYYGICMQGGQFDLACLRLHPDLWEAAGLLKILLYRLIQNQPTNPQEWALSGQGGIYQLILNQVDPVLALGKPTLPQRNLGWSRGTASSSTLVTDNLQHQLTEWVKWVCELDLSPLSLCFYVYSQPVFLTHTHTHTHACLTSAVFPHFLSARLLHFSTALVGPYWRFGLLNAGKEEILNWILYF